MYKTIYIILFINLLACNSNQVFIDDAGLPNNEPDAQINPSDEPDASSIIIPPLDSGVNDASTSPPHCGDGNQNKCSLGEACRSSDDCSSQACDYLGKCIAEKSCVNYFGGTTCGIGEVGDPKAVHESCCRSLPVSGYNDTTHPGKTVYVDRYEITAGRIRAFITDITRQMNGKPDIKSWIANNRPAIWNDAWNVFLPSDTETGSVLINRLMLGDPRHDHELNPGPGIIVPPDTDQVISVGLNSQFGGHVFADLHGNNCGTYKDSYGFPTYYYPADVQIKNGEAPRINGIDGVGNVLLAQDFLDSKSMNCITNAMLQAFCTWDGGELATSEVLDYITQSPPNLGNTSGCGSQMDDHAAILNSDPLVIDPSIRSGGRCPNLNTVNATFDAGGKLPTIFLLGVEQPDPIKNAGNFLNWNIYMYPYYPATAIVTSEKSYQVSSPGRIVADNINGWMDLAGNLSEAVLDTSNGSFTGYFGLKYRGIGYGSSRSDLNVSLMPGETILRIQRPEVKSALVGARCQRYK